MGSSCPRLCQSDIASPRRVPPDRGLCVCVCVWSRVVVIEFIFVITIT